MKCEEKTPYPTINAAIGAAIHASQRSGKKLRTYRCEQCGKWHMTSKPNRRSPWLSAP